MTFISIFLFATSFAQDKKGASKKQSLNISILLDLSDRINPQKYSNPGMEYYKRDLGYIESISKSFENNLRSRPIRQDDEYIQVYFEPEPLNPRINALAKKLKLSFTKDNTNRISIQNISQQYTKTIAEIYSLAIKDNKYIGSDIWTFFKIKVKDYCIKLNHRNILFILTDGYMFHPDSKFNQGAQTSYITPQVVKALKLNSSRYKDIIQKNGYGFVKATDNLSNLEVVILGIKPAKGNPFEGDVLTEYWTKWLSDMKVKRPILKPVPADLPSNLESVIDKYINLK